MGSRSNCIRSLELEIIISPAGGIVTGKGFMMTKRQEQDIKSLEEINEHSIKYWFVDENGKRAGKWVEVEINEDSDGTYYTVNRKMYRHQLYDFEISGIYVRTWKTVAGAIRFCKRQYKDLI